MLTAFIASPDGVLVVRLVAALVLGAMIGIERTIAHKKAGLRTYALVSMGSALFVIIGQMVEAGVTEPLADPLRMASQVITGIGFLGAGLIILQRSQVHGLTTAAGLWVAAGVGMAAGFGLYLVAITTVLLTIFVLAVLWPVELEVQEIAEPENGKGS